MHSKYPVNLHLFDLEVVLTLREVFVLSTSLHKLPHSTNNQCVRVAFI